MAETFPKIRQILGGIVDRSLADKLADLGKLADSEPANPGYPLVMAMVSSLARHNPLDAAKNLREAARRLKLPENARAQGIEALELSFAALAHQIVSREFERLNEPLVRGKLTAARIKRQADLFKEIQKAIAELGKVATRFGDSSFPQILHAGVSALSRVNALASDEYQRAVKALERFSQGGDDADLARFFLIYAHRRARDYRKALAVAEVLQRNHPNSAMMRQIHGSVLGFLGERQQAVASYKQAVALAPDDPATHLGLAVALERALDIKGAKAEAAKAASLDRKGQLKAPLKHLTQELQVLEKLPGRA